MPASTSQLPFPPIGALAIAAVVGLFLGLLLTSQSIPEPVLLNGLDREANTRLAYDFFNRQTGQPPPRSVTLRVIQLDQVALTTLRQHQPEANLQRLITQHHLPVVIDHVVWLRPNSSLAARVGLSNSGELISYLNGDVPVSTAELPAADVAIARARAFLDSSTGLGLLWLGPPQVEHVPGQPETEVRWQQPLPELPELTRVVLVRLRGETVWYFQHRLQPTTSGWARPFDSKIIYLLLGLPLQAILLIAAAVYLLKTSRRHVILWRVPTVAAVVVGVDWFFVLAPSLPYSIGAALFENPVADSTPARLAIMTQGGQFVLGGLVGYIISSLVTILLSMAVVWVVCAALLHIEYDTQRPRTEIFRAILLLRRVPYTTILQRGLIGGGVGWFLLGLTGLVQWLLADLFPVAGNINDNLRLLLDAWSPGLLMVGTLVGNTFDLGLVLVAFTWVAVRDWLRWPQWLALAIIALLSSVGWRDSLTPVLPSALEQPWLFLHQAGLALVLVATLERFGLWATLCAVWVYQATSLAIVAATLPMLGLSPWVPTLLVGLPFAATALAWRPPESERDRQPIPLNQFLEEQRHARQLALATQIQMSFLPPEPPRLKDWDIAAMSVPAREVGGDFYDFFLGPDGKLGIFAGDVSGKSVSGALFTAVAITAFRSEAEENELGCAAMLTRLNELLYPDMKRVRMFVAAVYVQLDPVTGSFTVANAGFPVVGRWHYAAHYDRSYVELLDVRGLPLGSLRQATYAEYQDRRLYESEFLVLASDGVVEALNERGEPYGYEALRDLIDDYKTGRGCDQAAQALCTTIISDVRRHMGEAEQADDMTVVVIQRVR
ncbi:PP2C family protein-serine/threonine phosphatase [Chloracidobacterium sp. MS 40/45]|uniref:PP2C family protein-serine/threonine phosphatase n=1 Tax=Chloracidobacterium aggregatum TaxID=2851959 RepID=UPI001B8C1B87|nr:PP2C family protein-serine/threonine phosphatase [Chloracidobacterium aggregatum]QUV99978.1 PP2C family protein-serine/threonine phosphatase [Chloracidobacterium sp. MS 40/45]